MLRENKEINNTEKLTWETPTVSAINTEETNGKTYPVLGEFNGSYGS